MYAACPSGLSSVRLASGMPPQAMERVLRAWACLRAFSVAFESGGCRAAGAAAWEEEEEGRTRSCLRENWGWVSRSNSP